MYLQPELDKSLVDFLAARQPGWWWPLAVLGLLAVQSEMAAKQYWSALVVLKECLRER